VHKMQRICWIWCGKFRESARAFGALIAARAARVVRAPNEYLS
jgi:hypothetical protein